MPIQVEENPLTAYAQAMESSGPLAIEDIGNVRVLRLNRPEKLNAFNGPLLQALIDAVKAIKRDDSVHCFIITGTPNVLSKQPSGVHYGWACGTVKARKVTLASVTNGQTVVVNGVTFTAHTNTTTLSTRTFSIAGTDTQDAAALAGCINDPRYGITNLKATASNGVITFTSAADIAVSGTAVDAATAKVEAGIRTIPVRLGY